MRWLAAILIILSISFSTEISINGTQGISLETLVCLLGFVIYFKKYWKKELMQPQEKQFSILSLLFLISTFFLVKDILISNYRSLYAINFLLLLFAFILLRHIPNKWNFTLLLLFISNIIIRGYFFPDVIEAKDYLDDQIIGRIQRLRIQGFESNSTGAYLSLLITFLVIQLKETKLILKQIGLFVTISLLSFLLIKTFSRGALLALVIPLLYLFRKQKFVLIISFIAIALLLLIFIREYEIFNLIQTRFSNIIDLNNPRLKTWSLILDTFLSHNFPVNLLVGLGFFKYAIDNTFLNILISYGLVGGLLFLSCLNRYLRIFLSYRGRILLIGFSINIFFMEVFAQKKIIVLLAFLAQYLYYEDEKKIRNSTL